MMIDGIIDKGFVYIVIASIYVILFIATCEKQINFIKILDQPYSKFCK